MTKPVSDPPELLPCPFCGGAPTLERRHEKSPPVTEIACRECYIPHILSKAENEAAAIAAWNRRTPSSSAALSEMEYVPIETPPALVEWKRVVNDAYLLLSDPRGDALWAGGVHEWLQRAVSLAERAKSADHRGEA